MPDYAKIRQVLGECRVKLRDCSDEVLFKTYEVLNKFPEQGLSSGQIDGVIRKLLPAREAFEKATVAFEKSIVLLISSFEKRNQDLVTLAGLVNEAAKVHADKLVGFLSAVLSLSLQAFNDAGLKVETFQYGVECWFDNERFIVSGPVIFSFISFYGSWFVKPRELLLSAFKELSPVLPASYSALGGVINCQRGLSGKAGLASVWITVHSKVRTSALAGILKHVDKEIRNYPEKVQAEFNRLSSLLPLTLMQLLLDVAARDILDVVRQHPKLLRDSRVELLVDIVPLSFGGQLMKESTERRIVVSLSQTLLSDFLFELIGARTNDMSSLVIHELMHSYDQRVVSMYRRAEKSIHRYLLAEMRKQGIELCSSAVFFIDNIESWLIEGLATSSEWIEPLQHSGGVFYKAQFFTKSMPENIALFWRQIDNECNFSESSEYRLAALSPYTIGSWLVNTIILAAISDKALLIDCKSDKINELHEAVRHGQSLAGFRSLPLSWFAQFASFPGVWIVIPKSE
jgi:hypothetical protein